MTVTAAIAPLIFDDVLEEIVSSVAKHGEQFDRPLGFGPLTTPLAVRVGPGIYQPSHLAAADVVEQMFKKDTDARSRSLGDGTLTWWHILREEVFEAAAESDPDKLRAELVQVAAVAVKAIVTLEHRLSEGLTP